MNARADIRAAEVNVTVNERNAAAQADVTGFGDVPLKDLPLSATVIDRRQIEASGARRLPPPVPALMRLASAVMKAVAYRL